MGFKQPRVPEYREGEGTGNHLRNLTLFLKDFCMESWKTAMQVQKKITDLEAPEEPEEPPIDPEQLIRDAMNRVYPVGSIYVSVADTDPGTLFGGTWERIKDTFLLSAGDTYVAGNIGGRASVTLERTNIPKLALMQKYSAGAYTSDGGSYAATIELLSKGTKYDHRDNEKVNGDIVTPDPVSIMPPYLAVYMWKRTA